MDDNNKILLLLIIFPFYTKIIIMFICLFHLLLLYLLFLLLLLLPSSDYSETLLYQVAAYAYCHHVWQHYLYWAIFAYDKNRANRQFRVLRAPYFALQSTPSALLQSLVRMGSQRDKTLEAVFDSCSKACYLLIMQKTFLTPDF